MEPEFEIVNDTLIAHHLEHGNLEHSIAKWEYLVEYGYVCLDTQGLITCALCLKYNPIIKCVEKDCAGCLVYKHTGRQYCEGTPYDYFAEPYYIGRTDETWRQHAQEELDFLISLRDEK